MARIRWYGPTILFLVAAVFVLAFGPSLIQRMAYAREAAEVSLIQNKLRSNASLADLSADFKAVAQVVEPSVVHIAVSSDDAAARMRRMMPFRFQPGPFGEMPDGLGEGPRGPQGDNPYEQFDDHPVTGNGSGWVYDDAGHIITNNHVVADASEITVRFHDGSERTATVVGADPQTDVAVLKVEGNVPRAAAVAKEAVEQGEIVFAFGSPFRFDFSMSQGIISAKGRQLGILRDDQGQPGYENFIQTDAAINPGNSGGPLTNIYGEVVGMNTAIASRTGVYNGLGFAIPVAMATEIADQIIAEGAVSRGYLGVYITDLDPVMARTFGLEAGGGVLVEDVIDDGPAADAGLKRGDVITRVGEAEVASADALRYAVSRYKPGADVEVSVFRGGKSQEISVELGKLPGSVSVSRAARRGDAEGGDEAEVGPAIETLEKLGIEGVQTYDRRLARQLGSDFEPGVLVTSVRTNSKAAAQGIARGTIITHVMDAQVTSVDDLAEAVGQIAEDAPMRLSVLTWDPRGSRFVQRYVAFLKP